MRTESVTLESGVVVVLAPLTLEQLDNYIEGTAKNDRMAVYQACVDSMGNAGPGYDLDRFRREMTLADLNVIQAAMHRVTGLTAVGETAASQ